MTTNTPAKIWWRGALFGGKRQRMELNAGETQHIQGLERNLSVIDGWAWVTINGTDIVLRPGQMMHLPEGHNPVLISGLKDVPLIYETW